MSQPFKLRYQNEIVGVFVLGAVATVFVVVVLMARSRQWFESTFDAHIHFDSGDVALVSDDLEVRIRSQVVGRVVGSEYTPEGHVIAHVAVVSRHRKAVHGDSLAVLYTPMAGLPGQAFIELKAGRSHKPIAPGGTLRGRAAEDLVQLATDVLTDTRLTLKPTLIEVQKLTRRLNAVLDVVAPEAELPQLTKRVDALLRRLDTVLAHADKLMTGADKMVAHTDTLVGKMSQGPGLMARMVTDPKLVQQVVSLMVQMQAASVRVERSLRAADVVVARADRVLKQTGTAVGHADAALTQLPPLVRSGRKALADLSSITLALKRVAPRVPSLMGQIDDVLVETRAVMGAAQRHWLLKGRLQPTAPGAPLPTRGLRDSPEIPADPQLRKLLGVAP